MTAELPTGSHPLIDTYLYAAISGLQEDHSSSYWVAKVCAFKSFSMFLVRFLRRVSLWGDLPRVLPETDKGIDFLRNGLNSELIQCAYIHINLFINISHTWPFHYKHATTISESKHYTGSLILKPFIKLHRLRAYMSAYKFHDARCKTLIRNNTRSECNC
jgi:hypothetical protein